MSYEYPRPTQVAPAARASQIGLTASLMFGCARDFVCTPSFKVGEAWPFVRPYTPLSWMTYNMSRFLRPAFTKWPPPIPRPSPSPLRQRTLSCGFASFTPAA